MPALDVTQQPLNHGKRNQAQHPIQTALTIALVTDDFFPAKTGVGVHVQQIAPELVKKGHTVLVLTSRRPGQPAYETWNGVHIHRFYSIPLAGFYQALPSLKDILVLLRNYQVDVVHFHYLSYLVFKAMQAAQSIQLPTVYTAHMTVDYLIQPLFMKPFHRFLTWGYNWLMRRVDRIVCVSRNQMAEFKPFKAEVRFISNPIDFKGDEASDTTRPDQFKVLYVGRLEPKKNLGYLIKAFQLLAAQRPNVELVIAGTGTEEQDLRRQVINANLIDKVTFLGHVPHDQLPALYASCDLFVLPSVLDTQGMVVLEAMRFRKPVIVTDKIVSAQELVDPGVNGFIVDADSVEDLADKLTFFYDNPTRRKQMGQTGHDRFQVETAASVAKKLSTIYAQHCKPLTPLKTASSKCHTEETQGKRRGKGCLLYCWWKLKKRTVEAWGLCRGGFSEKGEGIQRGFPRFLDGVSNGNPLRKCSEPMNKPSDILRR
ncbi:MAG: glycosyltransferase family 4 protein [Elusimicrobia bacterium]|nr:glycosyltransferase family 4 protein [Elusimicrobiota bacterium]